MAKEIEAEGGQKWLVDTYQQWIEQQGVPIITGLSISDLMGVKLAPWERKGGLGAFIRLHGAENNDAYLCEIPPGAKLKPQKHMFEELIYVLSGMGATTIWNEGSPKRTFEWQEGSLFSPPLNAWHQYFNGQSDKPAKFIGVTLAPTFLNLFNNLDFIFNNNYVFKNRFDSEEDYFATKGRFILTRLWETNFVPNVSTFKLEEMPSRGAGGSNVRFQTSESIMEAHVSSFPVGTYKNAHRHAGGAHIIILSGQGYTLLWKDDRTKTRIDWESGSMFAPPEGLFHQHFNTGKDTARYLALKAGAEFDARKFKGILKRYEIDTSVKLGGDQIEYEDEDPEIRKMYKEELEKKGVEWKMANFFPRD